jgi:hypothetical protein
LPLKLSSPPGSTTTSDAWVSLIVTDWADTLLMMETRYDPKTAIVTLSAGPGTSPVSHAVGSVHDPFTGFCQATIQSS